MLGSISQEQRSNAVGHGPAYLPELNPGMQGGGTYTGASGEATIQDYENIFGPSARDIKTDLQRFKRNGRWHLPDVLKGPNPWLTDRIDGLITDATNSPFTTKILPYLYKEDPDGKFKWNVWSFDEGMASRVPYESAARTLTQSKRSFAGYMVRQGMAIVMEHNFMMSPKGRENFKNQLNQLIGSIQYTNDLDVHMALVLAPSYQKTMRERYFSIDKAPAQICREFCDLFGMMQKNVNALDILIEEAKAILKTWGGPMPDFLLCNSKLTFQMTMTPEKTNYFTQGADGVKRLRQGPDLASYRGLSVIHSRAFIMEDGQHPRDILRRRVRTAEYYRILPHKDNIKREFELYNEERDTWFSMTFQDLLRYSLSPHSPNNPARYSLFTENTGPGESYRRLDAYEASHSPPSPPTVYGIDNSAKVHHAYRLSTQGAGIGSAIATLGAGGFVPLGAALNDKETDFLKKYSSDGIVGLFKFPFFMQQANRKYNPDIAYENEGKQWRLMFNPFDMGIKHIPPNDDSFPLWKPLIDLAQKNYPALSRHDSCVTCVPRMTPYMMEEMFHNLQGVSLYHPFVPGELCSPNTPGWFTSFTFYQALYRRYGLPMDYFPKVDGLKTDKVYENMDLIMRKEYPRKVTPAQIDITSQILSSYGGRGSVNHPLHLLQNSEAKFGDKVILGIVQNKKTLEPFLARSFLLTYEVLQYLLCEYDVHGRTVLGVEYILSLPENSLDKHKDQITAILVKLRTNASNQNLLGVTSEIIPLLTEVLQIFLDDLKVVHKGVTPVSYLCRHGVDTWPMGFSTHGHPLHPRNIAHESVNRHLSLLESSFGVLNKNFVDAILSDESISGLSNDGSFLLARSRIEKLNDLGNDTLNSSLLESWVFFWTEIKRRIFEDPVHSNRYLQTLAPPTGQAIDGRFLAYLENMPNFFMELSYLQQSPAERHTGPIVNAVGRERDLSAVRIDMNDLFKEMEPRNKAVPLRKDNILENIEIVIVRPNIEHNMLGIIMGLSGSELGYTLWGQTELSCYDDSMHGIWGMSYKYHARAIVFNEKNLIRLWDIAYDGYNGGKDDTHVDWLDEDHPVNGAKRFRDLTLDLGRNYRGPSMMVMAFVHDKEAVNAEGRPIFDTVFRRNWPSPIVFHDVHNPTKERAPANETLPLDYDNIQVTDVQEFRVFNNELYAKSYAGYREMMPSFHELHKMRKTAGQSSSEAETQVDSLAFQGSMRIKQDGRLMQEIQGSGHHGVDYVGVASIRAGKGIKYTGQAPTFQHMV